MTSRSRIAIVCLAALLCSAPQAFGETIDMKRAPVVKRGIGWRANRSEISIHVGSTVEDPYYRNLLFELGYNYHVTNWLGFGLNLGYSAPLKTGLAKDIETSRTSPGNSFSIPATYIGALGDVHVELIPLHGKSMLVNSAAIGYDFQVLLGASVFQVLWNTQAKDRVAADNGFAYGPMFGAGVRLFINRTFSLSLDCRDMVAKMYTHGNWDYTLPDKEWEHNVSVSLGFSVFLPAEAAYDE